MQQRIVPNRAFLGNLLTLAVSCVIKNCYIVHINEYAHKSFHLFLVALTIYVRYRQIIHVIEHHEMLKDLIEVLNKRSLYIGLASCYGISIVANFQET